MPIEVMHWNPIRRRFSGPIGRRIPLRRPVNNFGDLLGPIVVQHLLRQHGVDPHGGGSDARRLLVIGSILHFARDGDVLWGAGLNGNYTDLEHHPYRHLDVRAVRGPLTRAFLVSRSIEVPKVYGDPALLLPDALPQLREWASQPKRYPVSVIPNWAEMSRAPDDRRERSAWVDPRAPLMRVLKRIARSELVVGSSLHGLIVAESLGVPARAIRSEVESELKYRDYYEGTGRIGFDIAATSQSAIDMGGEALPKWDSAPLLAAFPSDLWSSR